MTLSRAPGRIRRVGCQQTIVARRSGERIAGSTRLKATPRLGTTEGPGWWAIVFPAVRAIAAGAAIPTDQGGAPDARVLLG